MVNRFEVYFVAYYAYFTAELHLVQFENLVFVTMSTRENIRLIARTPLSFAQFLGSLWHARVSMNHLRIMCFLDNAHASVRLLHLVRIY